MSTMKKVMNPTKRSEDIWLVDKILTMWNNILPKFKLTADDLLKPKPDVIMNAIIEILDALRFDCDGIIQTCPDEDIENGDALSVLVPVMNLAEAINVLLKRLGKIGPQIHIFDLITPTLSGTLSVFSVLLNYLVFVRGLQEDLASTESEVQNDIKRFEHLKEEVDQLCDELNTVQAEGADREYRTKQLKNKIERLRMEELELEKSLDDLHRQWEEEEEEVLQLQASLEAQQHQHQEMQHQVDRLRSCVVTEAERSEVLRGREFAMQREREAAEARQEAQDCMWGRSTTIAKLQENLAKINKVQTFLDSLHSLYAKIEEVEKTNTPSRELEAELQKLNGTRMELMQRIEEVKAADDAWRKDALKAEEEAQKELEMCSIEEKQTEAEVNQRQTKAHEYQEKIMYYKAATIKYNKEKEHLINLYTKQIPQEYDVDIEERINSINNIINNTLKNKFSKM